MKAGVTNIERKSVGNTQTMEELKASFPQILKAGKLLGDSSFTLLRGFHSLSIHICLNFNLNYHVFLNSIFKEFFSNMLCSISCPRYLLHVNRNFFHVLSALPLQKLRLIFCSLKLVNLLFWFISKMPVEAQHFAIC